MTLDEAVAEFERGRPVVTGLACPKAQTGEPYTQVLSGMVAFDRKEGEQSEYALATTENLAAQLWLSSVLRYAEGKSGALYWRVRPEMGRFPIYEEIKGVDPAYGYGVYSRLLISDKPAKYATIEEAMA